jgi:hypothetical protein
LMMWLFWDTGYGASLIVFTCSPRDSRPLIRPLS